MFTRDVNTRLINTLLICQYRKIARKSTKKPAIFLSPDKFCQYLLRYFFYMDLIYFNSNEGILIVLALEMKR